MEHIELFINKLYRLLTGRCQVCGTPRGEYGYNGKVLCPSCIRKTRGSKDQSEPITKSKFLL